MLAALVVYERQREITGTLADPLISTVQRIGAHAEREITQELVREFRKVAGKETLLFRLAEAAIARRDDTGRAVLYPVAGEKTLRDLVAGSRRTTDEERMGVWSKKSGPSDRPILRASTEGPRVPGSRT